MLVEISYRWAFYYIDVLLLPSWCVCGGGGVVIRRAAAATIGGGIHNK